ncbi:unnamed protein product [Arabidopsis halleri]
MGVQVSKLIKSVTIYSWLMLKPLMRSENAKGLLKFTEAVKKNLKKSSNFVGMNYYILHLLRIIYIKEILRAQVGRLMLLLNGG